MAKILIIDDSSLSRRLLRKILEEASYEVIEASDGYSALEVFTFEEPQLVMLDLTMPGINGFEVLKQLKRINPAVKVIVASADVQSMTRDQAFREGADGFINKPFVTTEITELVQTILSYVSN
ncbi:MAG TPA: response regulator [Bacteroidales bacterium]|nr:response regulator [Bacteroidales bacterium]